MRTLGDAWGWYESNRTLLRLSRRLGERHWDGLPWHGGLGNDDLFRTLNGEQVASMARGVLKEFDDLAVFLLFSVFEAIVRGAVAEELRPEIDALQHPALRRSAARMLQDVAEGSFYNNVLVLELYKRDGQMPANRPINSLIEEVNRVRRYRNWVAHGRKTADRPDPISPKNAHDALRGFLAHIGQEAS